MTSSGRSMCEGKIVILGVTGSIAAYKAVDLAGRLTQMGIAVDVIMTDAATEFVTPLCFQSITHRPVHIDMFAPVTEFNIKHVSLAERADVVVIAPATANTIAKLATGFAHDLLSCTVLSTRAPVIVAPAMDVGMYENRTTQDNLKRLRSLGHSIVGPASGRLASGLKGEGRLAELDQILAAICKTLGRGGDLAGRKVIISAGGTHEPIDAVRFIGNHSSGKMGFAIAEAARNRGAEVIIISAATTVEPPQGMETICVRTAQEMQESVSRKVRDGADVLIMAAAVADYRAQSSPSHKIKRNRDNLVLELVKTPDILEGIKGNLIKVGFAAESEDLIDNATDKLRKKGLDLIVANDITGTDCGFGVDTNRVSIIDRSSDIQQLPLMLKSDVAHEILDRVVAIMLAQTKRG